MANAKGQRLHQFKELEDKLADKNVMFKVNIQI